MPFQVLASKASKTNEGGHYKAYYLHQPWLYNLEIYFYKTKTYETRWMYFLRNNIALWQFYFVSLFHQRCIFIGVLFLQLCWFRCIQCQFDRCNYTSPQTTRLYVTSYTIQCQLVGEEDRERELSEIKRQLLSKLVAPRCSTTTLAQFVIKDIC